MKKLLLVSLLFPTVIFAELLSVDLICRGAVVTYCEDLTTCGSEPAMEKIKIDGNTLVHKALGNHFLHVDSTTVSMQGWMRMEVLASTSILTERPAP